MAKALPGRKAPSMSGTTKLLLWMGGAVVVLGAGITTAVLLSKPAAAAPPGPTPPGPTPPGPTPVVNPASYTFTQGHRYQITIAGGMQIPLPSIQQYQSTIDAQFPGLVKVVSVSQAPNGGIVVVYDFLGATQTLSGLTTPPPGFSVTVQDMGPTPSP